MTRYYIKQERQKQVRQNGFSCLYAPVVAKKTGACYPCGQGGGTMEDREILAGSVLFRDL